jgi:hypothetical protein
MKESRPLKCRRPSHFVAICAPWAWGILFLASLVAAANLYFGTVSWVSHGIRRAGAHPHWSTYAATAIVGICPVAFFFASRGSTLFRFVSAYFLLHLAAYVVFWTWGAPIPQIAVHSAAEKAFSVLLSVALIGSATTILNSRLHSLVLAGIVALGVLLAVFVSHFAHIGYYQLSGRTMRRADRLYSNGEFERAVAAYTSVIRADSAGALGLLTRAYVLRAGARTRLKEYSSAIVDYRNAIRVTTDTAIIKCAHTYLQSVQRYRGHAATCCLPGHAQGERPDAYLDQRVDTNRVIVVPGLVFLLWRSGDTVAVRLLDQDDEGVRYEWMEYSADRPSAGSLPAKTLRQTVTDVPGPHSSLGCADLVFGEIKVRLWVPHVIELPSSSVAQHFTSILLTKCTSLAQLHECSSAP